MPKQKLSNKEKNYFSIPDLAICNVNIGGKSYEFGKQIVFSCENMPFFKFGIEIGEDLFSSPAPSDDLARFGATIILNPSALPDYVGQEENRSFAVSAQSKKQCCAYMLASAGDGESTTDSIYAGNNIIAQCGKILASSIFSSNVISCVLDLEKLNSLRFINKNFEVIDEGGIQFSINISKTELPNNLNPNPFISQNSQQNTINCQRILQLQARGLAKRIEHTNCKCVVLGISGGLDSALAMLVCCEAMTLLKRPLTDILAISMPCFGTSSRTKNNAQLLSQSLGVTFEEINISKAVSVHFEDIGQDPNTTDTTFENSQARERTQILMDIAGKKGGFCVGTGDLSELALGWATYNGDHMSMYSVNASIPKTLVREVVNVYAQNCSTKAIADCLLDIVDTPISPELLPTQQDHTSQKTEDLVGPYELHDFFIYYSVKYAFTPSKIFRMCCKAFENKYQPEVILKWQKTFYKRFFAQQFKRSCSPDGVKVTSVSLSPRGEFAMPSDAVSVLWTQDLDKIKV